MQKKKEREISSHVQEMDVKCILLLSIYFFFIFTGTDCTGEKYFVSVEATHDQSSNSVDLIHVHRTE